MDNIRYAKAKVTDTVNHIVDLDMPTLPLCEAYLPDNAKLSSRLIGKVCSQCATRLQEMQNFQREQNARF